MATKLFRFGIYGSLLSGGGLLVLDLNQSNGLNSNGFIRFGRTTLAATAIAFDYKWNLLNFKGDEDSYEKLLSEIHLRSAERLKNAFCKNGGAFIKVGQYIGSLDYLLPREYVNTMKQLHDKAPESKLSELYETIEQDLNCKLGDIFKEIDSKPIGTASLAQCHKAVLHDGTVVAVKIQHPRVKANSFTDIKTMLFLVNSLAFVFPEFKFVWLAEETKKNLPIELDFINEGKNIEKIAKILENHKYVKVPKVFWQYSSKRILTMEFCEGTRIDNLNFMKNNQINPNKVTEKLGAIFSESIFSHGFVHADPHPGNVFIRPAKNSLGKTNFEIVLLDHGLYQSLSESFRYKYAKIWMAILDRDLVRLQKLTNSFDLGEYFPAFACIVTGRSWDSISKGIGKVKYSENEGKEIRENSPKYLREISIVLNRIPREMLLLLKTNDLLRGIETCFGHEDIVQLSYSHVKMLCKIN